MRFKQNSLEGNGEKASLFCESCSHGCGVTKGSAADFSVNIYLETISQNVLLTHRERDAQLLLVQTDLLARGFLFFPRRGFEPMRPTGRLSVWLAELAALSVCNVLGCSLDAGPAQ